MFNNFFQHAVRKCVNQHISKIRVAIPLLTLLLCLTPLSSSAQRRSRPGSMKHSQTEIDNRMKVTKVSATYIHDNSYFTGPIYRTGSYGGGIKIGTGGLYFTNGKYMFSFDAAKFKFIDRKEGSYVRSHYEKLAQDFEHSGKYEILQQYGQINLVLYDGDTDNVFASIKLSSAQTKNIEMSEDGFLIQLSYRD